MPELRSGQINLLRLMHKNPDTEGWVKVSKVVMPFVEGIPVELREIKKNDDGSGYARPTHEGNIVLKWSQ